MYLEITANNGRIFRAEIVNGRIISHLPLTSGVRKEWERGIEYGPNGPELDCCGPGKWNARTVNPRICKCCGQEFPNYFKS